MRQFNDIEALYEIRPAPLPRHCETVSVVPIVRIEAETSVLTAFTIIGLRKPVAAQDPRLSLESDNRDVGGIGGVESGLQQQPEEVSSD